MRYIFIIAAIALSVPAFAKSGYKSLAYGTGSKSGSSTVRPYVNKNGTYVGTHHRTTPDSYRGNNYGSYGNYNPYTGKVGNGY